MREDLLEKEKLISAYQAVRDKTVELCQPLEKEDYVIQSTEDVSPPKWHLAHTTWFFETFIASKFLKKYTFFNSQFCHLFNSYYHSIGDPYPKKMRGLLSRPTVEHVFQYRHFVDSTLINVINNTSEKEWDPLKSLIILGLHHEQQHQELLLMDVKHNFSINPDFPAYHSSESVIDVKEKQRTRTHTPAHTDFSYLEGGIIEIGNTATGFAYDNELPRHSVILKPYLIANSLVTNGEYIEFIEAGGYKNPQWWLFEGFEAVLKNGWQAPLYWHKFEDTWHLFTLSGLKEINLLEPVAHVSYFEADAYAKWRECRLPKESEWEHCTEVNTIPVQSGNFLETGLYHPQAGNAKEFKQLFGDLWEWTSSAYSPYPGFRALSGPLGEYNGKFMSGQMVLRGGSCITPQSHIRSTYRNFYPPDKRWQFGGIRLTKSIEG